MTAGSSRTLVQPSLGVSSLDSRLGFIAQPPFFSTSSAVAWQPSRSLVRPNHLVSPSFRADSNDMEGLGHVPNLLGGAGVCRH
jgi:hypothetical protein